MVDVNEQVNYKCRCGSRIELRIAFDGVVNHTPASRKGIYRKLAGRLEQLFAADPAGRLRLHFATTAKDPVVLSRKAHSRTVNVGDKGTTYGSLNLDTGEYIAVRELAGLPELLGEADDDFMAAVKAHGDLTGKCTFCGKKLSDPKSSRYGRSCAKKHRLPWPAIPLEPPEEGRARDELYEDVVYTCACGVQIHWRIAAGRAMQIPPVRSNIYPGLTATLSRFIQVSGTDHLRIRLVTIKKAEVVLSWNARSRAVTVSDGGTTKYGTLSLDDTTYAEIGKLEGMTELLREADASFIAAARRHGHETEHCSFCGLHLSDPQSLEVGYGPICAAHYDLPWRHGVAVVSQPEEEPVAGGAR